MYYTCNHEKNVPSLLSTQWLCGNSWTWELGHLSCISCMCVWFWSWHFYHSCLYIYTKIMFWFLRIISLTLMVTCRELQRPCIFILPLIVTWNVIWKSKTYKKVIKIFEKKKKIDIFRKSFRESFLGKFFYLRGKIVGERPSSILTRTQWKTLVQVPASFCMSLKTTISIYCFCCSIEA